MPAISARRAPSDAAAAPTRTIGCAHAQPEAAAVSARGASADAVATGTEGREHGDRDDGINDERQPEGEHDGPRNVLGGIAHLFPHRRDAGVSREREEEQTGGLQDAVATARPQIQVGEPPGAVGARPSGGHDHRESEQHDDDQHPGELCCACHPEQVDDRQGRDGRDGDGPLPPRGSGVGGKRDGHRRATRQLADDESPTRDEAPPRSDLRPPVGVRAARGRMGSGELGGCGGVAVGDEAGDREADQQARTRRLCRGGEGGEDPRADHRPETDEDGVGEAEATGERGRGSHGADSSG